MIELMAGLLEALKEKVLIADGAMGTELQRRGLEPGRLPELWNVERPDEVLAIHRSYVEAGAEILLTNTFGGSPFKLRRSGCETRYEELNRAGAELARQAGACFVLGDIGPCGELLEPLGTAPRADAEESFRAQATVLAESGVDAILVETMTSLEEALIALKASLHTTLPVLVSMSFEKRPRGFATIMGETPHRCADQLQAEGASMIGTNCGSALSFVEAGSILGAYSELTSLPLFAKPNAGAPQMLPDGTLKWLEPESWLEGVEVVFRLKTRIVGGCCGTGPSHISALVRTLSSA